MRMRNTLIFAAVVLLAAPLALAQFNDGYGNRTIFNENQTRNVPAGTVNDPGSQLLYLLDTEGLVFGRFQVDLRDLHLEAKAWGEPFDPEFHEMKTEIKAVTYHQLEVIQKDQDWQARVIFDI